MKKRETSAKDPSWRANWQREIEGAYLYRRLADLARTPEIQQALAQMAGQEEEHAALWAERSQSARPNISPPHPDLRVHLLVWLARWLGSEAILGLLINDEAMDIATYTDQAQRLGDEAIYRRVLLDETAHARALANLRHSGSTATTEPWHRGAGAGGLAAGGGLRL